MYFRFYDRFHFPISCGLGLKGCGLGLGGYGLDYNNDKYTQYSLGANIAIIKTLGAILPIEGSKMHTADKLMKRETRLSLIMLPLPMGWGVNKSSRNTVTPADR